MEINIRSISIFLAIITVALSAGFFYGWQISSIPGFRKVPDSVYLASMQSINRAILNPWFFAIFFGPLLLMVLSTFLQFKVAMDAAFWLFLVAALVYLFGNLGVTMFGNVPLNEMLDKVDLNVASMDKLNEVRTVYEEPWNRFNLIRATASIISFGLMLYGALLPRLGA